MTPISQLFTFMCARPHFFTPDTCLLYMNAPQKSAIYLWPTALVYIGFAWPMCCCYTSSSCYMFTIYDAVWTCPYGYTMMIVIMFIYKFKFYFARFGHPLGYCVRPATIITVCYFSRQWASGLLRFMANWTALIAVKLVSIWAVSGQVGCYGLWLSGQLW